MKGPDTRETGARIREGRRALGLTQKALAVALGVSTRSVQNYESGAIVPYRHVRALEGILGKHQGWLLDGDAHAMSSSVDELQQAIKLHSEMLRDQLELLERNLERLRDLRVEGRERRHSGKSRHSGRERGV